MGDLLKGFLLGLGLLSLVFGGFLFVYDGSEDETKADDKTTTPVETVDNGLPFSNAYRGEGVFNVYAEQNDKPLAFVINDQKGLDSTWFDLFASKLASPKPVVDFENQSLVVAMLDRKSEGVHLLTIRSLFEENNKLVINAEERGPGEGCIAQKKDTRPVHVIVTQKLEQTDTNLILTQREAAPCSRKLVEIEAS